MSKTIVISNIKGGVGKTTTCINLAVELGNRGKKVLVIDLDPQANLTETLCIPPVIETEETNKVYIDQLLSKPNQKIVTEPSIFKNVDIIPSHLELIFTEPTLARMVGNHLLLVALLDQVKNIYDYIFIDTSPYANTYSGIAISCADEVLIPIKINKYAQSGYEMTKSSVLQAAAMLQKQINFRLVFTLVNRNNLDREISEKIETDFEQDKLPGSVLKQKIRYQSKPVESCSYADTAVVNTSSNVGADYRSLTDELLKEWN